MIDRMDLAGLVYAVDRSHSKSILPTQNKLFTDEGNELGVSEKVEMVITVNCSYASNSSMKYFNGL